MKKISVVIPCWSEEKSVKLMYDRLKKVFDSQLTNYDYEIIFVDDHSPDNTWVEIEKVCKIDKNVKGILNAKNFGFIRNVFFTLKQGTGDATFMLFGDLQDPPELLPDFVKKWEEGYKVIIGQKVKSEESKILYFWRSVYYKFIGSLSSTKQIQHFNGYGLYDKNFINTMNNIDDPIPYLKGIVAEFSMNPYIIQYEQSESNRGKSGSNFFKNYDLAMLGITSYTKTLMRMATFVGGILGIFSLLFAIFIFINKILNWNEYPVGTASIIIGIFFIGAVQLFFIGILGEYILSINTRVLKRPLVVVEKSLNFDENNEEV
ncbi:MAG: glycosyltransferase family 2 protein [Peptoanaerobacter stomatis]|uniref:glycosyltransferase family 2 protein n=1 Tax=Peptoanaerobacter stomatis TaxID=796937 RepID=UPI003F9ED0BA